MKCVSIFLAAAIGAGTALPALGQEAGFTPPKTSWGAPDLTGFWSNESRTVMNRANGAEKLIVTESEEIELLEKNIYTRVEADEAGASDVSEAASKKLLSDNNSNRGYNRFWMEPGSHFARVKGEIRTSWVVDPPDGRVPYKPSVRRSFNDYSGPEARPVTERCLRGFTNGAGPVINNGMYNNNYQIVQTPENVLLFAEMIFESRIIPIVENRAAAATGHGPAVLKQWTGDSVGWYEGNTLVVETINVAARESGFVSEQGKVVERFTRWNEDQILYAFTVDDPTRYTQTWKGEMAFNASDNPPFEYACHEGNYGLLGILEGARKFDRDGREHQKFQPVFGDLSE